MTITEALLFVAAEQIGTHTERVRTARTRSAFRARRAIALALRDRLHWSQPELGRLFGRDRSSIHSLLAGADNVDRARADLWWALAQKKLGGEP